MKDDPQLQKDDVSIWLALKIKFKRLQVATTPYRPFAFCPRDQDDPHDDAHLKGENSVKRQKTSKYGTFKTGGSSSGQDYESRPDSYAIDDDMLPNEKASQELVDEISQTVDEAKLRKVVDEIDIAWESKKEIIVPLYQPKPTPVVQSCQRDPKAFGLPLVNQDLLYLKKGNSGSDKIVLSLHKFLAVIFPDDDIKERASRWVKKCVKRFNPYACYGVEHWKNLHVKIFYIKNQQAPGKLKEQIYSNSKIVQIIKTYWELGHEHKFITEIVARRENRSIVSITESDYKNLNKNDIKDMYLLIINHKVDGYAKTRLLWSLSIFISSTVIWERVHDFQLGVESYQQRVSLTASIITLLGIEKYKMFFIISELVYGIIYKNNKKEKRVMRHQEVHKFCDATLKRVLEGLKSYNNDVKYGYVTHNLSKEDVEYLQLFAEEIEEWLKFRDQIRRWEMFRGRTVLLDTRAYTEEALVLHIAWLLLDNDFEQSYLEQSHKRQTGDGAQWTDMTTHDIEALYARAEAAEQQAETLHVSLGATRMDVRDLIESCDAERLEMAERWSRARDIEASF
ncbi:hypothetical protein Tco_0849440 [Tanacetum coccineum]